MIIPVKLQLASLQTVNSVQARTSALYSRSKYIVFVSTGLDQHFRDLNDVLHLLKNISFNMNDHARCLNYQIA